MARIVVLTLLLAIVAPLPAQAQPVVTIPSPDPALRSWNDTDVDGGTIVAGARLNNTVYEFFEQPDGSWAPFELPAPEGANTWGSGVAIEGGLLAVATTTTVHVYRRAGEGWEPDGTFERPSEASADSSLLIMDGAIFLAGTEFLPPEPNGDQYSRSAVTSWEQDDEGAWQLVDTLSSLSPGSFSPDPYVAGDGGLLVLIDHDFSHGNYVATAFTRQPDGSWASVLLPDVPHGTRIAAVDDGRIVIAACCGGDGDPGEVRLYYRNGSQWVATPVISPTRSPNDGFGRGVALSGDDLVVTRDYFVDPSEAEVYRYQLGADGTPGPPQVLLDGIFNMALIDGGRVFLPTSVGGASIVVVPLAADTAGPRIAPVFDSEPNAAGWYNAAVTVRFTCVDASEVTSCPEPHTFDREGADQEITVTATDVHGNSSELTVRVSIDVSAPELSFVGAADRYALTDTVDVTCDAADALSGVSEVTCDELQAGVPDLLLDGQLALGDNALGARAVDRAGNEATASATVSVVVDAKGLRNLLRAWLPRRPAAVNTLTRLGERMLQGQCGLPLRGYALIVGGLLDARALTQRQAEVLLDIAAHLCP